MRRFLYTFIAALFLLYPQTTNALPDDPLADGLRSDYSSACSASVTCTREVFLDLAFPLSADGTARARNLTKWTEPIAVIFAAERTAPRNAAIDDVKRKLDDIVATMSSVDINISRRPPAGSAKRRSMFVFGFERLGETVGDIFPELSAVPGLEVAYGIAAQYHQANQDKTCAVGLAWNSKQEIVTSVILIDLKKQVDAMTGCLANMLASSMGFLGKPGITGLDAALDRDFMQEDLKSFDKLLLQILNNAIIKPGMTIQDVKAAFPQVYAQYRSWRLKPSITFEPIDQKTYSCMASVDCAKKHFLKMAVTGSRLEPKAIEQRVLFKLEIPTAIALIEGDDIEPGQLEAARSGYRDALALAKTLRMPIFPLKSNYPRDLARIRAYLSKSQVDDREGAFASWLVNDQQRWQYDFIWDDIRKADRDIGGINCRAWYVLYADVRFGLHSASAAIPARNVNPKWISRCVFEEIVQSFGLPTDIEAPVKTLFDDRPDNLRITAFDLLMFALLYHPWMQSGMREDQVAAVFDRVYHDIWQQFMRDPALRAVIKPK